MLYCLPAISFPFCCTTMLIVEAPPEWSRQHNPSSANQRSMNALPYPAQRKPRHRGRNETLIFNNTLMLACTAAVASTPRHKGRNKKMHIWIARWQKQLGNKLLTLYIFNEKHTVCRHAYRPICRYFNHLLPPEIV